MAKTRYATIDAYLSDQSSEVQAVLGKVRAAIRKAVPKATECISYQIPAFKLDGRPLLYFAGWTDHYAIYPVTDLVRSTFAEKLAEFDQSKGTIRFPYGRKVPVTLIGQIARVRAKECAGPRKSKRA